MLLTIKSICCKRKILQVCMFICISILKHNTFNGDISGKVNVVLCNAVKLLLLSCHLVLKVSCTRKWYIVDVYQRVTTELLDKHDLVVKVCCKDSCTRFLTVLPA